MITRRTRSIVRGRAVKRAKWKGKARVRRLLLGMPDATRLEIAKLFEDKAPAALAYARINTPRKTGALANALRVKTYPKRLALRLGLLTKGDNREFFYGRILDRGRRPQSVNVKRTTASGAVSQYVMKVSAIPAARFDIVYGRVAAYVRNLIGVPARDVFAKALRQFSGGMDGD